MYAYDKTSTGNVGVRVYTQNIRNSGPFFVVSSTYMYMFIKNMNTHMYAFYALFLVRQGLFITIITTLEQHMHMYLLWGTGVSKAVDKTSFEDQ